MSPDPVTAALAAVAARSRDATVHVIGFGNLLQGDDGFGVHVVAGLRARPLPPRFRVFDGGLLGAGALGLFEGCDEAIVVDALASQGEVGRLHCFGLDEVASPPAAFSAHLIDVHHLVHLLPIVFADQAPPRITVVGAEIPVPDGHFTMTMAPPVDAACARLIELLRDVAHA